MQEDTKQSKRITGLGFQNQCLKDEMAYVASTPFVADFGDDLGAEEQAHQPATQQHGSYA
jgi:hypothetical protein